MIEFKINDVSFSVPIQKDPFFNVKSSNGNYSVTLNGFKNPANSLKSLKEIHPEHMVVIDQNVREAWQKLASPRDFVCIASEDTKTLRGVDSVFYGLLKRRITKSGCLIAIGGGIVQDVAGTAAALYKRGIPWFYYPTTLLSQSDSCIGGKTSLNFGMAKNQLGLFYPPKNIRIQSKFLSTLSEIDQLSGLGEILKMCIIGGPWAFLEFQQPFRYERLIKVSLLIKKEIIEADEFDTGSRRALNYGHTFGHIIESLSHYKIPHGTAVVLGILIINEISCKMGWLPRTQKESIFEKAKWIISEEIFSIFKNLKVDDLSHFLRNDKKTENNGITIAVAYGVGEMGFELLHVDTLASLALEAIDSLLR